MRGVDRFRWVLWRVVAGGLVAHVVFPWVFLLLGSRVGALGTAVGLLMPVLAYMLLRRGRLEAAFSVACVDITASAVLGTMFAGEGSGFLFYMMIPLVLAAFYPMRSWLVRWGWVAGLGIVYLALESVWLPRVGLMGWSVRTVRLLHGFNVMVVSTSVFVMAFLSAAVVGRTERELGEALRQMEGLALQDGLTGLPNRRATEEALDREAARGRRSGVPYCVVMADIDRFKSINDEYGHAVGDEVLRAVAGVLRDNVREQDVVGRWGGEEFLMVLPETGLERAAIAVERLRAQVERHAVRCLGRPVQVTMTFGVVSAGVECSCWQAVEAADRAMYDGKASGRNCVVVRPAEA